MLTFSGFFSDFRCQRPRAQSSYAPGVGLLASFLLMLAQPLSAAISSGSGDIPEVRFEDGFEEPEIEM